MNEGCTIPAKRPSPYWNWLLCILATAGFFAVCFFSYIAWFALKAEENLIALTNTTLLVESFVERTKGDWPSSWEQLAQEHSSGQQVDWQHLRRLIDIDFQADPKKLAQISPADFKAIWQKDQLHHFEKAESLRCDRLILALRRFHEPRSE